MLSTPTKAPIKVAEIGRTNSERGERKCTAGATTKKQTGAMKNATRRAHPGIEIRKSVSENTEGGIQFRLINQPMIGILMQPATAPAK